MSAIEETGSSSVQRRPSRRDLLTSWKQIVQGATAAAASRPRLDPGTMLRPPGALSPDSAFVEACTGCGDCVTACPTGSILAHEENGGKMTPGIDPGHKPCYLCSELPCIPACSDGALADPGGPQQVRIGVARVDPRRCVTFRGELCQLCFKACPFPHQAIMMIGSRPLVREAACTGCGLCVRACPTVPRSIAVIPERHLVPGLRIPREEYQAG